MAYEKPEFNVDYIKPDLKKQVMELEVEPGTVRDCGFTVATAAVAAGTWIVACTRASRVMPYRDIDINWEEIMKKDELRLRQGGGD